MTDTTSSSPSKAVMRALEGSILLSMIKSTQFVDRVIYLLEDDHFSRLQNRFLFSLFKEFHTKYKRAPTPGEFNVELTEGLQSIPEEEREPIVNSLEKIMEQPSEDPEYIIAKIEEFVQQADVRSAIVQAGQALEEGDVTAALEFMKKPSLRANSGSRMATEFLSNFQDRIHLRKEFETLRRIPTGIEALDIILGGGLAQGELGTILAATNVGKSQGLLNFGGTAIKHEKVALYLTLELSKLKVFSRMDSLLTDIPVNFLTHQEAELRGHLDGLKKYKDLFYCEEFPSGSISVEKVISFVKNFKRSRGKLDLLLLDYADLLSIGKHQDLRIALGTIYKMLRGLASEEEIAIWNCSQSNRAGFTAEHVSEIHSAESIDKMFVTDVVISLNQKPEEYPNRMRLFVVKARDAVKWAEIPLRCDLSRSKLWQDPEASTNGSSGSLTQEQTDHVKEILRRGYDKSERPEEQEAT